MREDHIEMAVVLVRVTAERDRFKQALELIYEAAQKGDGTSTECEMAYIADDAFDGALSAKEGDL